MTVQYRDLVQDDEIKSTQQSNMLISGKLLESPLDGETLKPTVLIWCNGHEDGMVNEQGSVYPHEITQVRRNGEWHDVAGQPATENPNLEKPRVGCQKKS